MNTSECSLLELKCQDRHLCILSEFGELIEKVFGVLTYQLEEMRDLMLTNEWENVPNLVANI